MKTNVRHNMHSHYRRVVTGGPLIVGGVLVWPELFNNDRYSQNPKKSNDKQYEGRNYHDSRRTR